VDLGKKAYLINHVLICLCQLFYTSAPLGVLDPLEQQNFYKTINMGPSGSIYGGASHVPHKSTPTRPPPEIPPELPPRDPQPREGMIMTFIFIKKLFCVCFYYTKITSCMSSFLIFKIICSVFLTVNSYKI
jgi:hypothetical protein